MQKANVVEYLLYSTTSAYSKVDPIVWTKKDRSFVTPVQVFPTGKHFLLRAPWPRARALARCSAYAQAAEKSVG